MSGKILVIPTNVPNLEIHPGSSSTSKLNTPSAVEEALRPDASPPSDDRRSRPEALQPPIQTPSAAKGICAQPDFEQANAPPQAKLLKPQKRGKPNGKPRPRGVQPVATSSTYRRCSRSTSRDHADAASARQPSVPRPRSTGDRRWRTTPTWHRPAAPDRFRRPT